MIDMSDTQTCQVCGRKIVCASQHFTVVHSNPVRYYHASCFHNNVEALKKSERFVVSTYKPARKYEDDVLDCALS